MPPDQAPPHRLPDSGRASGGPPAGAGPRAEAGASPLPARLTPREREVLGLVAAGRSNAGIAAELVLSGSAVTKYVNAIFTKLDLRPDPPATAGSRSSSPTCARRTPRRRPAGPLRNADGPAPGRCS
ncbi:response regulator transcription factor [Nocardiopsis composta]